MTDIITPDFNPVHRYTSKNLNAVGMVQYRTDIYRADGTFFPFSFDHPGIEIPRYKIGLAYRHLK